MTINSLNETKNLYAHANQKDIFRTDNYLLLSKK